MKYRFTKLLMTIVWSGFASIVVSQELPKTVSVLSGVATVIDGDGILFGKLDVRLQGIAAPEFGGAKEQEMGAESRQNLVDLAWGKFVVCHLDGTRAGGRPVGICYLNNQDLGRLQVLGGYARDCKRYSKGRYLDAELKARANGGNLSAIYKLPEYCF